MPITFPSSPSNADEYTFNGRTYTYNAARGVWLGSRGGSSSAGGGGGAALTVSDTAPTSASEGDLWFHSTLLETYVYYNSQWVLSNPSGGGGGSGASLTSSDTAPATPSAGDLWFNSTDLTTYVYYDDGSSSQWVSSMPSGVTAGSGGGGVSVISGTENFPANTDSSTGDMVYETDSNKLFIFNGSGWDSIQATQNQAPSWSPVTTSFNLSNDGTPTVVNLNATDPEGIPLTYNYSIDSGNSAIATVALSGNTLTVTPTTDDTISGNFILSVSAYDNSGNSVTQPFNFALSWAGVWYGDRGLHIGGLLVDNVTSINVIQYFDITSTGNAIDFGDLVTTVYTSGACSNSTYALSGGGYDGAKTNVIEYVTVATTSNSSDFGDLTVERYSTSASSNGTYGLWSGGNTGSGTYGSDVIDYVTIASTGNAADFGILTVARSLVTSFANSTYSVTAGGRTGNTSSTMVNTIDYVTVATTSNASDFGDLGSILEATASVSDDTYGVIGGGRDGLNPQDYLNTIQYVTIDTPSNTTDFGYLTVARAELGGCSNGTRGAFSGGYGNTNGIFNTIDYVTITSPSNATDLGDLLQNNRLGCATSGNAA